MKMYQHVRPMYEEFPPYVYPVQPQGQLFPNKMLYPTGYQKQVNCNCGGKKYF